MTRVSHRLVPTLAGSLLAVAMVGAQAPRFEVASVKPNLLDDRIVTVRVGPGPTFMARGYTLVLLIQRAYGVMEWNVSSGPAWIRSDPFDVLATADIKGALTEELPQPRLATLVAERFKLRLHESTQEMDAYALEVARGGPKVVAAANQSADRDAFSFTATGLESHGISMADL